MRPQLLNVFKPPHKPDQKLVSRVARRDRGESNNRHKVGLEL